MKTYLATVCLTKTYTDKMCNQVLLQKEFPDEKAAHAWLNKALERYNYVAGIKGLCYVSWFSLDDENGTQLNYASDELKQQIRLFRFRRTTRDTGARNTYEKVSGTKTNDCFNS